MTDQNEPRNKPGDDPTILSRVERRRRLEEARREALRTGHLPELSTNRPDAAAGARPSTPEPLTGHARRPASPVLRPGTYTSAAAERQTPEPPREQPEGFRQAGAQEFFPVLPENNPEAATSHFARSDVPVPFEPAGPLPQAPQGAVPEDDWQELEQPSFHSGEPGSVAPAMGGKAGAEGADGQIPDDGEPGVSGAMAAPALATMPDPPQARRRRRRHRITFGVITLVILAVVVAVAALALPSVKGWFSGSDQVKDFTGSLSTGGHVADVVIESGDTGVQMGKRLVDAGIIATTDPFTDAFTATSGAESIKPGTYRLPTKISGREALNGLMSPEYLVSITFTVPEGYRAAQIYDLIAKNSTITVEQLEQASQNTAAIGLPAEANGMIEGWLFPAQYSLDPDASATDVLSTMVKRTTDLLKKKNVEPARWSEIIILASMVEKESKLANDRPKVARVFYNRLAANMALQSDATVSYGAKRFNSVDTTDAERGDDNPWNTYIHKGLPTGAICNPGEQAINAALKPAAGPWVYFVAVNPDTGETKFAVTPEDHQRNVEEWQEYERSKAGK